MIKIYCPHQDATATKLVCVHLTERPPDRTDYHKWFTGKEHEYHLICLDCHKQFDKGSSDIELQAICAACFANIETEGSFDGLLGQPEIYERATSLAFSSKIVTMRVPINEKLLAIQPLDSQRESVWIGITEEENIWHINLASYTASVLAQLPANSINFKQPLLLRLSLDGRYAAVANTHGQHGVVIDLATGRATMHLQRDNYCIQHSQFPLVFFEQDGRTLLVHGTLWNRLDISDPRTGTLLTERTIQPYKKDKLPEHYLDYFHCGLTVSPDQEWIVDNGWRWTPIGFLRTWNLQRWFHENVWESEDGPSKMSLGNRWYYWDGPLCWVDNRTLAVWGYGEDDIWLLPAIVIFDVVSGKELRWFAGPQGNLFFDDYLFSYSDEHGTAIWDITTGERLLHGRNTRPTHYHLGAKQFLRVLPDGTFEITILTRT